VRATEALGSRVLGALAINAPAVDTSAISKMGALSWMPAVNSMSLGSDRYGDGEDDGRRDASRNDDGPQVATRDYSAMPQQDGGSSGGHADSMVITIRSERGSSAEVTQPPKGGTKVVLARSGSF